MRTFHTPSRYLGLFFLGLTSMSSSVVRADSGVPIEKLHPAIVHFPIALLVVAAALEFWAILRRRSPSPTGQTCLYFGVISALIATYLGWELAEYEQEYHGELEQILLFHRWGGIGTAVCATITAALTWWTRRGVAVWTYRFFLLLSAVGVGGAAHFGGLLVHGADYYDDFFGPRGATNSQEVGRDSKLTNVAFTLPDAATNHVEYARDVHPLLEEHCARCHGKGKSKGDFQIDSREDFLRGGESGKPSVVVGDSAHSYLIELVSGKNPKKIMPNKGKRLTVEQVGILRAWIDQGFEWGGHNGAATRPARIQKVGYSLVKPAIPSVPGMEGTIDRALDGYFRAHSVSWGPSIDDRGFARRVYLDLTGMIPPYRELAVFLASTSSTKRIDLVRALLDRRQDFALHWLSFWNDALRNDYSGPGFLHGERTPITNWLYASLHQNMRYDQFARELVSPVRGSGGFVKGILWWKDGNVTITEDPAIQAAQNVSQLFMGVNMKCATCHSSFTDEWKLSDAYGLANVFVKGKPLEVHECNNPTGKIVPARFLYPELGEIPKGRRLDRMAALAPLLTSEKNGRFARTFVNRMWRVFFGRGLVEPLDEMDVPPWSKELLDGMAAEFIESGFDVRALIEKIVTSRAYQLITVPAMEKYPSDYVFRGPVVRKLTVEQMFDSLGAAFGVTPDALTSDVERSVAVTVANPFMKSVSGAADRGTRILFASGPMVSGDAAKPFSVNLSGVSSLWLVTLKRYSEKSAADRLREKFDQIQKQDSGLSPIGATSSQAQKDQESKQRKGKSVARSALPYSALWESLSLTTTKGRSSLSARVQGRTEYREQEFSEESSDAAAPEFKKLSFDEHSITTQAFSAVRYYLGEEVPESLTGSVKVTGADGDRKHAVEFVIVADLPLRAALLEATPTLLTLGRPRREQIATSRNAIATTIQALESSNGNGVMDLLRRCAKNLMAGIVEGHGEAKREVMRRLLGREPTKDEQEELLPSSGGDPEEDINDFLWAVISLPEFELIT